MNEGEPGMRKGGVSGPALGRVVNDLVSRWKERAAYEDKHAEEDHSENEAIGNQFFFYRQ